MECFIKKVIKALRFRVTYINCCFKSLKALSRAVGQKKIFLFGSPYHVNAGDQAQTLCTLKWMEKFYPDYIVFLYSETFLVRYHAFLIRRIARFVTSDDKIFLHSGYHTTNLYRTAEKTQRETLRLFPDHRITILPQTIYFTDQQYENDVKSAYNKHKNVTLLCRDSVSYHKAKEMFPEFRIRLYPDIVSTMIGAKYYDDFRSGILMCMRKGVEAKLTREERNWLQSELSRLDTVAIDDTDLDLSTKYICNNREAVIHQVIEKYARYKVIITDRYHGMIFSLAANTPVLVIPTTDHKLSSGADWFLPEYPDYIRFVPQIKAIPAFTKELYNRPFDYHLHEYFNTAYYDKLKDYLEEKK